MRAPHLFQLGQHLEGRPHLLDPDTRHDEVAEELRRRQLQWQSLARDCVSGEWHTWGLLCSFVVAVGRQCERYPRDLLLCWRDSLGGIHSVGFTQWESGAAV
jgi:hypothetical protein